MFNRQLLPFLALVLALYSTSTNTHVAGQNGTNTSFSFDVDTDNTMDIFTFVGDAELLGGTSPFVLLCFNGPPTTHGSTGRALYKHPVQFFQEPDSS
jgi:hypothetical protein